MRCPASCSGAGKPTPAGGPVQSWPIATERVACMPQVKEKAPLVQKGGTAWQSHAGGPVQSWPIATEKVACMPQVKEKAPLVQRGDSMAKPCRGDCEVKQIYPAWLHNRVRDHNMTVRPLGRRHSAAPLVAAWRRCHIRGDCKARQMIQLGAVIGCGSTAWPSRHGTGSTAWERRLAVNPSVGVRRQLPLHKGGPVAGRPFLSLPDYTQPT